MLHFSLTVPVKWLKYSRYGEKRRLINVHIIVLFGKKNDLHANINKFYDKIIILHIDITHMRNMLQYMLKLHLENI